MAKKRRVVLGRASEKGSNEPDALGVALQQKRKSKVPRLDQTPSLYTEDLGVAGVKPKKAQSWSFGGNKGTFDVQVTNDEARRRKERQTRFSDGSRTTNQDDLPDGFSGALSSSRWGNQADNKSGNSEVKHEALIGTNQSLVKQYLRLTTFPRAQDVRPLAVLRKALQLIKRRYIKDEDFEWANEQLKSVRQDIAVQGIRNDFVLDVYETHARILLENGDLNEFNQCQTMIRTLTTGSDYATSEEDEFKPSKYSVDRSTVLSQSEISEDEFHGYRLLYALIQKSWTDLAKGMTGLRDIPRASEDVDDDSPKTAGSRHAVLVVKALTHNDYHAFFRLYDSAPHLSAYLMDFLVKRVRDSAFERIIAAYRPTVSVEHFRETMHFRDLEETREFLQGNDTVYIGQEKGEPPFWVDCKQTSSIKK